MPYSKVSFRMILSDLERLNEIFNDTKHRAASLRQLSNLVGWWTYSCCHICRISQRFLCCLCHYLTRTQI